MLFNVVSPIAVQIDADSFKEAIKQFAKLHYHMNLSSIIIRDQMNRNYRADLRYYSDLGRRKVGIDMYPTSFPFLPIVMSNN
jgi:hypothetical protein